MEVLLIFLMVPGLVVGALATIMFAAALVEGAEFIVRWFAARMRAILSK